MRKFNPSWLLFKYLVIFRVTTLDHCPKGPHSKKKNTSKHLFWCFRLSQIENSIQNLEGPNGIWKDHDRHIGVPVDPKMPIMVLLDTIWSFNVLNRVLYLWQSEAPKKVLGSTFFIECTISRRQLDWWWNQPGWFWLWLFGCLDFLKEVVWHRPGLDGWDG